MKKIGIYAGAFDPVHNGHVQFALDAIAQARLDKVYFLVEPDPRHKQGVKALEHRAAMVRLAIRDHKELGLVLLDQVRFNVHETWPVLQRRFAGAELSMLMGGDVFARLSHWPRVDELLANTSFIVGQRATDQRDIDVHLTALAKTKHITLHYMTFYSSLPTESSTHIRRQLRNGTLPRGIDPRVASYINENKLYSSEFEPSE